MMNLLAIGEKSLLSKEYRFALQLTIGLTIIFTIVVLLSAGNISAIMLFPLIAVQLALIFNFELSLLTIVVLLFANFPFIYTSAVLFSIPLGVSFIIRHRDIEWKEFANPITIPIIVYGFCILPSFLNSVKPLTSFLMLFNVVAFLIVTYSIIAGVRTYKEINKIVAVFLVMVLLNSLDVFRLSVQGANRPFGFAGIMFVDYSALGICLAITIALISHGLKRIFFLLLSFIPTVALILTQTRNTWLSAVITIVVLIGYLIIYPNLAGFSRKQLLLLIMMGLLVMVGVVMVTLTYNPRIEKRATELTLNNEYSVDESGKAENSMVTRLFIWDTALNAFRAHPIVGIGVYGFGYSSHQYYQIPKILYTRYVANASPHQTHIAVLAETGIIGFIGFIVFIFSILKYTFRTVREAVDNRGKRYALVGLIGVVYCVVSMLFTDAWLWGQGIVLLGLVVGLMLVNRKISCKPIQNIVNV
ncbi:MAG: hypothetical protein C0417_02525 [Chlorobiaceae bacterium]|nr:hypothetical protein [Chlorobiaceae bacterium]